MIAFYRAVSSADDDTCTGENFEGVDLTLPLGMYEEGNYDATAAVAAQLGLTEEDWATNLADAIETMSSAMKLTLLRKEGQSFADIFGGLSGDDAIDETDLTSIRDAGSKAHLTTFFWFSGCLI